MAMGLIVYFLGMAMVSGWLKLKSASGTPFFNREYKVHPIYLILGGEDIA